MVFFVTASLVHAEKAILALVATWSSSEHVNHDYTSRREENSQTQRCQGKFLSLARATGKQVWANGTTFRDRMRLRIINMSEKTSC